MALIEKLDYESVIVERMRKTLRIGSLRDYLIKIYTKYEKLYGRNYIDEAFGWFSKQEDPLYHKASDEHRECIIENGFYVYLIIKVMIDSIKPAEKERYMKLILFKQELDVCDKTESSDTRIGKKESNSSQEMDARKLSKRSLAFYKSKILQIDIIRDSKLEKIYFPKMPYCFFLPKKVV
jgi:hypothetical protein